MKGIGPPAMKTGDIVCVIYGTPTPFIIRQCDDKENYILMGECYIDDIMRGVAVDTLLGSGKWFQETWISLI